MQSVKISDMLHVEVYTLWESGKYKSKLLVGEVGKEDAVWAELFVIYLLEHRKPVCSIFTVFDLMTNEGSEMVLLAVYRRGWNGINLYIPYNHVR